MSGVIVGGQVARALNLPQAVGLMVQQVAANSPAAHMDLRPGVIPASIEGKSFLLGGDIILAVQEREIGTETYEALQARLQNLPRGSTISVLVLREGRLLRHVVGRFPEQSGVDLDPVPVEARVE